MQQEKPDDQHPSRELTTTPTNSGPYSDATGEPDAQNPNRELTTEPRTSTPDSDVMTEPDDQYPITELTTEPTNSFDTNLAFSNGPEGASVNQPTSHERNIVIGVAVSVVILVIICVGVVYVYCKRKVRSKKYYESYC